MRPTPARDEPSDSRHTSTPLPSGSCTSRISDVGCRGEDPADRLLRRPRLSDDLDVVLHTQEIGDPAPYDLVVIEQEHADRHRPVCPPALLQGVRQSSERSVTTVRDGPTVRFMQPDTARHRLRSLAVVALALPALTVGCGDDTGTAAIATTAAAAASTTVGGSDTTYSPDTTSPDTAADTTATRGATTKVNANDASSRNSRRPSRPPASPTPPGGPTRSRSTAPTATTDGRTSARSSPSTTSTTTTFEQIVTTLEL